MLDHGELLEFDAPHTLLNNPESHLTSLVTQLGETEFGELRRMANIAAAEFDPLLTWF